MKQPINYEKENRMELLLRELSISPAELARRTGVSEATISQNLRGKSRLTEKTALKIKEAFRQVNLEWLLTGEGQVIGDPQSVKMNPAPTPEQAEIIRQLEEQVKDLKAEIYDLMKKIPPERLKDPDTQSHGVGVSPV